MKKNTICIIPARGGSKRIHKKNIKNFFGKPIIAYAIKNALKSGLFKSIIVSTDNDGISKVAKRYGVSVHIRSKNLANDKTDTRSVIVDVIKTLEKKTSFSKVCCIYPTSVFFKPKELVLAYKKLTNSINYVFTAAPYDHPIFRSFEIKKKKLKMIFPKMEKKRTQELATTYHDAAQFYFGWKSSWLKNKKIFHGKSKFIEMPKLRFQDIDDQKDWDNAKIIWKLNKAIK